MEGKRAFLVPTLSLPPVENDTPVGASLYPGTGLPSLV